MVFALVLITFLGLLLLDLLLRKEDKTEKVEDKKKSQPIFLSPEKLLIPIPKNTKKHYHQSHTWMYVNEDGEIVVGYDQLVPFLFSEKVEIEKVKSTGDSVKQGNELWRVRFNDKSLPQLAPVTGRIVEINPALTENSKYSASKIAESWIMKISPSDLKTNINNLHSDELNQLNNQMFKEKFMKLHNQKIYMNDGGSIDPNFINNLNNDEWNDVLRIFSPYRTK